MIALMKLNELNNFNVLEQIQGTLVRKYGFVL